MMIIIIIKEMEEKDKVFLPGVDQIEKKAQCMSCYWPLQAC